MKLKNLEVLLWGNRIDAAGKLMTLTGTTALLFPNLSNNVWQDIAFLMIGGTGLGLTGICEMGLITKKVYEKTKRHIEKSGHLSDRFARTVIEGGNVVGGNNYPIIGYCEKQGMYLAAKEMGCLDDFRKSVETYSNCVVPHF